MTFSELKAFRRRAPYLIALTCALPFFAVMWPELKDAKLASDFLGPILALIVASAYVALDVRKLQWFHEVDDIQGARIRNSLLEAVPDDLGVNADDVLRLRPELFKPLTGVFWEAVDNDPKLKELKQHFYANGAIYTTSIDVMILGSLAGLAYAIEYLVTRRFAFGAIAIGLVAITLISWRLALPNLRANHLRLLNQQLELLTRTQRAFIQDRIREIVTAHREERGLGEGGTELG